MKLLIVRHAESNPDGNGFHHNEGVIGALSESGKAQAELLAKHLSTYKVGYIYSSDILRAAATAYVISDGMPDVTVMLTKDLRMIDPSESAEVFKNRVETFLNGLRQKYEHETIIIVSHSDVIQNLFDLLGHNSKVAPELCSVSEFDVDDDSKAETVRVNDTKY
ncbi:MAG: histidine phosphatase family protein [Patescibacteria group bacterium]|nr:histidine phosphatase family protein [Patescibacteria group bacterium]